MLSRWRTFGSQGGQLPSEARKAFLRPLPGLLGAGEMGLFSSNLLDEGLAVFFGVAHQCEDTGLNEAVRSCCAILRSVIRSRLDCAARRRLTGCFTVFCPEAALRRPALQRLVLCDAREVRVGGEQPKLVTDAELGEDRVDGAHLEAAPARAVAELCGFEVVVTVGTQEGEGTETRHDRLLVARSVEALEELLVDEPRRHDEFASRERPLECADLRHVGRPVAAKRQRPDARVDEEAQLRERSLL